MKEAEEMRFVRSALTNRLSRHPALHSMYLARLSEILDTIWDEERLYQRIDTLKAHVESAEAYPNFEDSVFALRTWIEERRGTIQQLVDAGGDVGEEPEEGCVPGMNTEELLGTGEFVSTASISCAHQPNPRSSIALVLMVFGFQRIRSKRLS